MYQFRAPSAGLTILENLHSIHPFNNDISSSLINAYIQLGFHDKAIKLIELIAHGKQDVDSLKLQAWLQYKQGNIEKERSLWNTILTKIYLAQIHSPIDTLILRSSRIIDLKISDIPLISVVRNEMLRLPFFLDYYRALGVTQFIFVDNNSNDGSFEFLLEQPDCHVFWTNNSYEEAGSGISWTNYLIHKYILPGQWFLVIDADEFLVYPYCETKRLNKFTQYLDLLGYEGISSYFIDTFPKFNIVDKRQFPTKNLIKLSPYFCNKFNFQYQPVCPYIKPKGGIRSIVGMNTPSTILPLMKYREDLFLLLSRHCTTPLIIADITSAILHIKFIGSFVQRSKVEMKRKELHGGAQDHNYYIKLFDNDLLKCSTFRESIEEYQNSQQLVDLGLIRTTDEWDSYVSE